MKKLWISTVFSKYMIVEERVHSMEKNAKIYVAGHRGMVGSAIVRK